MGKILKTVFQYKEPDNTNVLWIKPEDNVYKTFLWNHDAWELINSNEIHIYENVYETNEAGFYLVDQNLNIGYQVTPTVANLGDSGDKGISYINYKDI